MLLGAVAALFIWLVIAVLTLLAARRDMDQARDQLSAFRRNAALIDLLGEGPERDQLRAIERKFDAAEGLLRSPVLLPLRVLPVVGRQLRSATALADGAGHALDVGLEALSRVDATVADGFGTGAQRQEHLLAVGGIVADARHDVAGIDLGPDDGLVASLRDARAELAEKLVDLETGLQRAEDATKGFAAMLAGSHRYLVLAANNAQMQNGSGMMLSSALLEVDDGRLALTTVTPNVELPLPNPPVALDPDLAALWPSLNPNNDWRHLGTTNRFPITAATASAMWDAIGQPHVDGVLAVDAVAMAALLDVTGPVTIDTRTVSSSDALPYLLHDQYVEAFGDSGRADHSDQERRRDQLSAVAEAAVTALDGHDAPLRSFKALGDAVAGRHLLAWSSDPGIQAGFVAAGLAGTPEPDAMALGLLNRGGNKLDWFVHVDTTLEEQRTDHGTDVTVRVVVRNTAPASGQPDYILGPYPGSGLAPGEYLGILALTVPSYASGVGADAHEVAALGRDGDHSVIGVKVQIKPGATDEVVFHLSLPPGVGHLGIDPSARADPIRYHVGETSWTDRRTRQWTWCATSSCR